MLLKLKKGKTILFQGETTNSVYVVKKGIVRAYASHANGTETIIGLFGANDYFPSSHSNEELPIAMFYYDMQTDGEIERINVDDFFSEVAPKMEQNQYFEKRYIGALLHVSALAQTTAYEKLLHTFLYLALRFGVTVSATSFKRINIKLTQQDLASLCNVSRETANIEVNKLKAADIVLERNKYYTVNMRKLNQAIGDQEALGITLQ